MGWMDMLHGASGGGIGAVVDFGLQALGNAVLPMSKAQRQQNEYASSEAAKARDFSAQQAEMNRDWQEEMYAKYDSLQGKINQAQEAGVNPMYAVTGSATSPMSASSPSVQAPSASPGSVSPIGQISDMASAMLGFSKVSAEIDHLRSITRNQNAQALKSELESLWVDKLNEQTIKESNRRIQSADVSDAEKAANTRLLTEKALSEPVSRSEMQENIRLIASEIELNSLEGEELLASIRQMDADVEYKSALTAGVLLDNALNEKYGARMLASDLKIKRNEAEKLSREIRSLVQTYGHDKLMYAYEEIIKRSESNMAAALDPGSYTGVERELRIFLNEFKEMFNVGFVSTGK